jgi:hypothetical protein
MQRFTGQVNTTLSFWVVVLVYVILGLLEVDATARKIQALPDRTTARLLGEGSAAAAAKFRRYMAVRTLMSALTGILVWIVASLFGLPLAQEWGVIAFALNYIPFIGPIVATLFPTLFAMVEFGSWQAVVAVLACLYLSQSSVGSYLEPRLTGSALVLSPFVLLFSIFLWTFLWGLSGTFIGVPIAVAVLPSALTIQTPRGARSCSGPRMDGRPPGGSGRGAAPPLTGSRVLTRGAPSRSRPPHGRAGTGSARRRAVPRGHPPGGRCKPPPRPRPGLRPRGRGSRGLAASACGR